MIPLIRTALVTGIAAITLAACGAATATDDIAADPEPDTVAATGPDGVLASLASTAPLFDDVALAVEGRDTVLWFWAPWCTACRAEAPDVSEVSARFGDRVEFVGVAGRGELAEMRRFVDETDTRGLDHVADLDGEVWADLGIIAQPALAFVDDGGEVEVFVGGLGADELTERVEALLAT